MINILLDGPDLGADYLRQELSKYIRADHHVVIVAFSCQDAKVRSLEDWNALYSRGGGAYYDNLVGGYMVKARLLDLSTETLTEYPWSDQERELYLGGKYISIGERGWDKNCRPGMKRSKLMPGDTVALLPPVAGG